ncbi:LysR substrate-binding domain-containing protein [Streptomyces sp. NBC_00101]|uniref:LysR family transcriptional regulator n=1 Tax=Streptomyces sp. NBC_00101 TaxID=2975651 RepID=UPI00324C033E
MSRAGDVHLRELRYFTALAEELHFTRAAERLFVSQPALSKQIRTLEKELGAELFARHRRGVRLTSAGEALRPYALAMLAAWEACRADVGRVTARERTTVVVGTSASSVPGGLLPAIRSRLAAAHPGAEVRLRRVGSEDVTAGLAGGECDVAFVWLPVPGPERFAWTVVSEEQNLVALTETHPLAAREEIAFTDLLDEPFLALPESAGPLRDHWLALGSRGGRPPRIGGEVNGTAETHAALAAGLGVCLVARGNAQLIALDGVTTRPVTGVPPSRLALAWRRDDTRLLVRAYAEAARQVTGAR